MGIEGQVEQLLADARRTLMRPNGKSIHHSLDDLEKSLDTLYRKLGRPGAGSDGEHDERASAARWLETKALADQPRRGGLQSNFTPSSELIDQAVTARAALTKLISLQAPAPDEIKALSLFSVGTNAYFCPPEWATRILSCIVEGPDVLGAVFTQTIGAAALNFFTDDTRITASWHCESDCSPPPSQDLAGQLGQMTVGADELRFATCATRALIEDSAINLEDWLLGKATIAFRRALADAVMLGTGIGQPAGILRAAIPIYESASAPAGQFVWQDLVSLWAALPAAYRPNASWVLNSLTLGYLLTLSDASGRPIVLPSLAGAVPLSLLGRPILIDERLPNPGAGATPILLADLAQLYVVILRSGPTLLPPIVSYCITYNFVQRAGGAVQCPNAGVLLRIK